LPEDDAAPPPLDDAAPPPDPPLLLEAAPPPLPEVPPEPEGALGAGAEDELDEDDFPALPLLPGVTIVVSRFSSHAASVNAPRSAKTKALVFRDMLFSL
jgi:hypothetical protein